MTDVPVRVVVTAVDSTAGAFKTISDNAKKLNSELGDTTKASGSTKNSILDLAKGVFLGQAAFSAAQKAIGFVTSSLKEGIQEAISSQQVWSQVALNVANAGINYEEVRGKIEEVSKANMQLGFSDEETASSVSRLMLATHDASKAFELNAIAMDLARFKNVSLENATIALSKAYAGNKVLLRQLGVEVDEAANREQTLAFVHQQTADAAKRFSETTAGQLENVKIASQELKEQIGYALLPVISYLLESFRGSDGAGSVLINVFKLIGDVAIRLITVVREVGVAISNVFAIAAGTIQGFIQGGIQGAWRNFKDQTSAGMDTAEKVWMQGSKKIETLWKGGMQNIGSVTAKTVDSVGDGLKKKAEEIAKQIAKENEDFARDMEKMTKNYERSLKDLVIAHVKKTKDIKNEMDEENKTFEEDSADRKQSFDEEMADMKTTHERKVEDIQAQIDEETAKGLDADAKRLASLQLELKRENEDFTKESDRKKAAYEKETQKAIEEHAKKLLALQEELNQEMALQTKYGDDFAKYKDQQADDDITRLKETFKLEMEERKRQHEAKLNELKVQGETERAVYEAARSGNSGQAGNIIGGESSRQVTTNTGTSQTLSQMKASQPVLFNNNQPVSGGSATLNSSSGGNIFTAIGNAVSGVVNWFKGLLHFQSGGVVPGYAGQPRLAVVHGQEEVVPVGAKRANNSLGSSGVGNTNLNISFSGTFLGSETEMRVYAMKIWDYIGQVAKAQNKTPQELLNLKV